jgi:flavin-dependent dehydrogenase
VASTRICHQEGKEICRDGTALNDDQIMDSVDVVIFGGGPAGIATALALSRLGFSAALIDRCDQRQRIGETLPPTVKRSLVNLGLWEHFLAANHSPSFGMRVTWGHSTAYENDFVFNPYGHGWHVDRTTFDAMLMQAAIDAGARVYQSAKLSTVIAGSDNMWRVRILRGEDEFSLHANVVVDATGRRATLARTLGSKRVLCDRLIGAVGFFASSAAPHSRRQVTLIEACEYGWWYSSMLPNGGIVVAHMTDADLFAKNVRANPNFWQDELAKTADIRERIQSHSLQSSPIVVPAFSSRLSLAAGSNWLAVGDAAAAYDPLSSQGICNALTSAQRAAHVIGKYLSGDAAALNDYTQSIDGAYAKYLRLREQYYSNERRWLDSAFWKRRCSAAVSAIPALGSSQGFEGQWC